MNNQIAPWDLIGVGYRFNSCHICFVLFVLGVWSSVTLESVLSLSPTIMAQAEICTRSPRLLEDEETRKNEWGEARGGGKPESTEEGEKER